LRLREAFPLLRFESRTGLSRDAIAGPLAEAVARGWLRVDGDQVCPTDTGQRFANDTISLFLPTDDA
jgi:coproporphyrinogen III oxidase-like Fe-S oxidoreductase